MHIRGDKEVSYNGSRTAGIIAIPEERVHRILTHDRPKNRDVTCACVCAEMVVHGGSERIDCSMERYTMKCDKV